MCDKMEINTAYRKFLAKPGRTSLSSPLTNLFTGRSFIMITFTTLSFLNRSGAKFNKLKEIMRFDCPLTAEGHPRTVILRCNLYFMNQETYFFNNEYITNEYTL